MSLFTCRQVSMAYEGRTVLSGIDFSVNTGDYLGIIGENGAGKSTLIKGLLGMKKNSGGEMITDAGLSPRDIGYLPQQTPVQKDFPACVWEVVLSGRLNRCGMYPFYRKRDKEDALEKMDLLGITPLKNRCYRDLYQIFRDCIEKYGLTIVMVSHDVEGTLREANRILHLADGGQLFYGSKEDYLKSPLRQRFTGGGAI